MDNLREVKRFYVKLVGRGLALMLSDGATRKVWKELARYPGSVCSMDYMTQEAVIFVPKESK